MDVPDLSVIVVNWNTVSLLRDCLRSVTASAGVRLEIIVVENGSTDGSPEMVRAEFPEARLIPNAENRGFAPATNQGLAIARGRHHLLLNSDTVVAPDALARLVEFLDDHPRAGACGPQLRNSDGTLQPSGRAFPTVARAIAGLLPLPARLRERLADPIERRDYSRVAEVDEVSGAALCLRSAALAEVGLLDERFFFFGEDVDLCWRLRKADWSVYYVPEAVVIHRWGSSRRRLSERVSLLSQRATVLLLRKHRPGLPALTATALVCLLTILKAARRALPAALRGHGAAAVATWRTHQAELAWLVK